MLLYCNLHYLWWRFFFNTLQLSLWFKSKLFFLIRAAGRRLCLRVRINADCPIPCQAALTPSAVPATSPMLLRSMSDRAPWHVPLSATAFFWELSPPPGSTSSVQTQGSYQPRRQAGDVKVKFMSGGTWVALGVFGFGVIAEQAVLARSMGMDPAWGKHRNCQQQTLPPPTETGANREIFKKPLGEVSLNAKRRDCHLQYHF